MVTDSLAPLASKKLSKSSSNVDISTLTTITITMIRYRAWHSFMAIKWQAATEEDLLETETLKD